MEKRKKDKRGEKIKIQLKIVFNFIFRFENAVYVDIIFAIFYLFILFTDAFISSGISQ